MKDKTLRNKQIMIRITEDENQQIKNACESMNMSQSDYIRLKIFVGSQLNISNLRDIHDVRVVGIVLTKIFEQLQDTQIIPYELLEIDQLITEIKLTVRRLNDQLDQA